MDNQTPKIKLPNEDNTDPTHVIINGRKITVEDYKANKQYYLNLPMDKVYLEKVKKEMNL